jgi:hypothetical protein
VHIHWARAIALRAAALMDFMHVLQDNVVRNRTCEAEGDTTMQALLAAKALSAVPLPTK